MEIQQPARFEDGTLTVEVRAFTFSTTVKAIEHNWNWSSMRPDGRARVELGALSERLNAFVPVLGRLVAAGGHLEVEAELEAFVSRHVMLTRIYWARESRCASWFVCGSAKFPVERNRKHQASSDKARVAVVEHEAAARKAIERKAFPHGAPGGPIRSSNPDAPELLREEIAKLRGEHTARKLVNEVIRAESKKGRNDDQLVDAIRGATGWSESVARQVIKPNYMGRRGFEGWKLSNTLAEIKRLEGRLAQIEAKRSREPREATHETTAGKVDVIENGEADRIQIVFPGKPDTKTRDVLKANGFRWAPSQDAWQRHLNENGRYAAQRVLKALTT